MNIVEVIKFTISTRNCKNIFINEGNFSIGLYHQIKINGLTYNREIILDKVNYIHDKDFTKLKHDVNKFIDESETVNV